MKIKYLEITRQQQKGETTLLDVLNWENEIRREDICFTTDSMDIVIEFLEDHKTVYIWIGKARVSSSFSTSKLSPEKIIEAIETLLEVLGVEYEN